MANFISIAKINVLENFRYIWTLQEKMCILICWLTHKLPIIPPCACMYVPVYIPCACMQVPVYIPCAYMYVPVYIRQHNPCYIVIILSFMSRSKKNIPRVMGVSYLNIPRVMGVSYLNIPRVKGVSYLNIPRVMGVSYLNIPRVMGVTNQVWVCPKT